MRILGDRTCVAIAAESRMLKGGVEMKVKSQGVKEDLATGCS